MTYDPQTLPELADEYVLGLLDTAAEAELEAEMERSPELRAAVAASCERFLPLDAAAEPSSADEALWHKIEAKLPRQQKLAESPPTPTANDNKQNGWRTAALSAMAASLLLAVGLGWSLSRKEEPMVIAVLLNEAGVAQAVVEDFGNENASVRLLADFQVPANKTIQVWTLPSKEMGPVSLGLLRGSQSAHLEVPSLPVPKDEQLYELTLEQAGGSQTGRPTGPILAKGLAKQPR